MTDSRPTQDAEASTIDSVTASPAATSTEPSVELGRAFIRWARNCVSRDNLLQNKLLQVFFGLGTLVAIALKFVVLPTIASRAVEVIAEGYGIDLKIEDWNAGLLDLNASAKDVTLRVNGQYAQAELLTIDEVELDLSLWRRLRGKGWINEVRVQSPKLYLERGLSGNWNWHELGNLRDVTVAALAAPETAPRGGDTVRATFEPQRADGREAALFNLPQLRIEGMRMEWVENLPGDSGGGLINEQRATLFLDDVVISASDLVGLLDPRAQPSRFNLSARTADGKMSMSGQGNFFAWSRELPGRGGVVNTAARPLWAPAMSTKLYLENIGAGAFARLTPEVAVRPARGTMSGSVELALHNHQLTCKADVEVRDMSFAVNRSSPLMARKGNQIEREVAQMRPVNGRYQLDCGGLGTAAEFRPVQAFQSSVMRAALSGASLTVRSAAAADHTRYSAEPLEPQYRSTVAVLVVGVDSELLRTMDLAIGIHRQHRTLLDRLGLPRGLPGFRR